MGSQGHKKMFSCVGRHLLVEEIKLPMKEREETGKMRG